MAFQINTTGAHPHLGGRDVRRLINKVLGSVEAADEPANGIPVRLLPGGYSGSLVAIVWMREAEPIVIKAGPTKEVMREFTRRNERIGPDEWLAERQLDQTFGPIDVDIDGTLSRWSALCYRYVGGKTQHELQHYSDLGGVLESFVADADRDNAPSAASVQACLRRTAEQLVGGDGATAESHGRDLSSYLPSVPWDDGIRAAINVANSLWPDLAELQRFPEWYAEASSAAGMAPVADERTLHGDARLANILVNWVEADVHLVDYGNGRPGHLFEDLVRLELDLLIVTAARDENDQEILQDDLLRTFNFALRDVFSLHHTELNDRSIRCLQMWRQQLVAAVPHLGAQGTAVMYRWFLLVECLKRLRWVADNGPVVARIDAPTLLRLICLLRARISGAIQDSLAPISTPADALRALHCTAAFVPTQGRERSVNEKRNFAKRSAILEAAAHKGAVQLIAETGQSYLSTRGAFGSEVRQLLAGGGSLEVVVCNPNFIEAYGISLSFGPTSDGMQGIQSELHQDLAYKIAESLRGYQLLREEFGERVEVRFARFGVGASVLIAHSSYFFEPYFRAPRTRRLRVLFDTFELQFRSTSVHIKTLVEEAFAFHWAHSDSADDVGEFESQFRTIRNTMLQLWRTGVPN